MADLMPDRGDGRRARLWRIIQAIGGAGATARQVELKQREAWDRFLDFAIAAWLGRA
jgi:hypothetical protein